MEKPAQYEIRNYVKGDEAALAKIFSECFGPTVPRELLRWYRSLGVHDEDVFVGAVNEKLVSAVELVFKNLDHGEGVYIKTAGISGVCTDSDYRCRGIVSNLMKTALQKGKERGLSNASLYTSLDNPAHRIYERLGFVDVMTWRTYIKYIDYPAVFQRWVRQINRSLKDSKIALRKLEGWDKSVVIRLRDVGVLSFRFRRNGFQRLVKPPKRVDIEFSTDLETYARFRRGVVQWEDAVKDEKIVVVKGDAKDIEMLRRVLRWRWDE
jgi:ribosomal protein S18 acetylase RimI-like enzyme